MRVASALGDRALCRTRDALGGYTDLQTLSATKDKDPLLTYWFGIAARELLKLEEARKHFQKSRELNPKWAEPAYELIVDLVDQGKLKQALDLTFFPELFEVRTTIGPRYHSSPTSPVGSVSPEAPTILTSPTGGAESAGVNATVCAPTV